MQMSKELEVKISCLPDKSIAKATYSDLLIYLPKSPPFRSQLLYSDGSVCNAPPFINYLGNKDGSGNISVATMDNF